MASLPPWQSILQALARGEQPAWMDPRGWPLEALIARSQAPQGEEIYSRTPLHEGPEGEVVVGQWRDDVWSAPHDHAQSQGWVWVLRGAFVERHWRFDGQQLHPQGEQTLAAPGLLTTQGETLHDMKGMNGGVTLHAYVPAVQGMRVFDVPRRRIVVVRDHLGAWIPSDPRDIVSSQPW